MKATFGAGLFDSFGEAEAPRLILCNPDLEPVCELGRAFGVKLELKASGLSALKFSLPSRDERDGEPETPHYGDVRGKRYIHVAGLGYFRLEDPVRTSDGVRDRLDCTAYSAELTFADKAVGPFTETMKFYNAANPSDETTVFGLILSRNPGWSAGTVSSALWPLRRTLDVQRKTLWSFIRNDVQSAYQCFFMFDCESFTIDVAAASELAPSRGEEKLWLAHENLVKLARMTENTSSLVTCLAPQGAGEVDIRRVNPRGDNFMYDLGYYVGSGMVSDSFASAWNAYQTAYEAARPGYEALSVSYRAALADVTAAESDEVIAQDELTACERIRSAQIASGMADPSSSGYAQYTANNSATAAASSALASARTRAADKRAAADSVKASMEAVNASLSFEQNFTAQQIALIHRLTHAASIVETSFAEYDTDSTTADDLDAYFSALTASFTGGTVTSASVGGETCYRVVNCEVAVSHGSDSVVTGEASSADVRISGSSVTVSAELTTGETSSGTFEHGTLTLSGQGSAAGSLELALTGVTAALTVRSSEARRVAVSGELYDYAKDVFARVSLPEYSFEIDPVCFLAAKSADCREGGLSLLDPVALELPGGTYLPLLLGLTLDYGDARNFSMRLSNKLADGSDDIGELIAAGADAALGVASGSPSWAAYSRSGRSAVGGLLRGMQNAARNAVVTSENQEIRVDGSGIHAREVSDGVISDEQLSIANNIIALTDDGWATAKVGIGKFNDQTYGTLYGVAAPAVVGTLVAGEELKITNSPPDGEDVEFTVDGDGVTVRNADISMSSGNRSALLSPETGLVLGTGSLVDADGNIILSHAKFYADADGNLTFRGALSGATGTFSGALSAATGTFSGELSGATGTFSGTLSAASGNFAGDVYANALYARKGTAYVNLLTQDDASGDPQVKGQYLSLKGLTVKKGTETTFAVDSSGNVTLSGTIEVTNDKAILIKDGSGTLYGWIRYDDNTSGGMYTDCVVLSANITKKLVVHGGDSLELHAGYYSTGDPVVYSHNVNVYNGKFYGTADFTSASVTGLTARFG